MSLFLLLGGKHSPAPLHQGSLSLKKIFTFVIRRSCCNDTGFCCHVATEEKVGTAPFAAKETVETEHGDH